MILGVTSDDDRRNQAQVRDAGEGYELSVGCDDFEGNSIVA